jgi:hypothetical protein
VLVNSVCVDEEQKMMESGVTAVSPNGYSTDSDDSTCGGLEYWSIVEGGCDYLGIQMTAQVRQFVMADDLKAEPGQTGGMRRAISEMCVPN